MLMSQFFATCDYHEPDKSTPTCILILSSYLSLAVPSGSFNLNFTAKKKKILYLLEEKEEHGGRTNRRDAVVKRCEA
jgi:hypothetical protein